MRLITTVPELLQPATVELPTSRRASNQAVNVLATLSQLTPRRALHHDEIVDLAERQAKLLLRLARLTTPPTPSALISELPRVLVRLERDLPVSAAAHWINGRWLLLINLSEPLERQRFSVCHEYKHCIDHPLRSVIYRDTPATKANEQAELAAEAFAAAVLMPADWMRTAWDSGVRSVTTLSRRFRVSRRAMERRLAYLGLRDPKPTYPLQEIA